VHNDARQLRATAATTDDNKCRMRLRDRLETDFELPATDERLRDSDVPLDGH